jgi:hypothetical protein
METTFNAETAEAAEKTWGLFRVPRTALRFFWADTKGFNVNHRGHRDHRGNPSVWLGALGALGGDR